jgi:F-box/leucine-rich repeat protein 2/20
MQELKNLNAIIIDGARVSDTVFQTISNNCRSLIEIGLSKCTGVTNMRIMQLVSGCVNLKTINLTCCRSITDAAISAIADSCRNLLCLKLESCNMITEKSLEQLGSHCALLEELDLTDCFGINDRGKLYEFCHVNLLLHSWFDDFVICNLQGLNAFLDVPGFCVWN